MDDELTTTDCDGARCTHGHTANFLFDRNRRLETYRRTTPQVGAVDPPRPQPGQREAAQ